MPTLKEMNDRLSSSRQRKEVLKVLIDYLETNYRKTAEGPPKYAIKLDDGSIVPDAAFELEIADLAESVNAINVFIQGIENMVVQPVQAAPPPVVTPIVPTPSAPVAEVAPPPAEPVEPTPPVPPAPVQEATEAQPKRRGRKAAQ